MKHITILVPETAVPAAIVDPQYMFKAVNDFFEQAGRRPPFQVQLAAEKKQVKLNNGMFYVRPDAQLKDIKRTDLVIIPALSGNMRTALSKNKALTGWIADQHARGAEVASLCVGAFLLASTGLLNGKTCSTHWLFVNDFRAMFPDVMLVDDKVITDQNGIYSSGGASSYWSLLLYLVEKYTNRETAILASKFFLLDIDKNCQSPFIIFRGQKDHEDKDVIKIQDHIERNYRRKITVEELSEKFNIARRSLERRFKKATSNTVVEYIQRVKVEAAKKQLEAGRKTVNEVMYDTGYTDSKAFRDVFRKITGMSPNDYRNRYNKALA